MPAVKSTTRSCRSRRAVSCARRHRCGRRRAAVSRIESYCVGSRNIRLRRPFRINRYVSGCCSAELNSRIGVCVPPVESETRPRRNVVVAKIIRHIRRHYHSCLRNTSAVRIESNSNVPFRIKRYVAVYRRAVCPFGRRRQSAVCVPPVESTTRPRRISRRRSICRSGNDRRRRYRAAAVSIESNRIIGHGIIPFRIKRYVAVYRRAVCPFGSKSAGSVPSVKSRTAFCRGSRRSVLRPRRYRYRPYRAAAVGLKSYSIIRNRLRRCRTFRFNIYRHITGAIVI